MFRIWGTFFFLYLTKIFANAFQELEGQSYALVTSIVQRGKDREFICAACYIQSWEYIFTLHIFQLWEMCTRYWALVCCGICLWVMQSKCLYRSMYVHRERAAWRALGRFTSFLGGYSHLPYKWGAPVHGFSFGSIREETMLNGTAVCFSMYCVTNNGCKALLYLM